MKTALCEGIDSTYPVLLLPYLNRTTMNTSLRNFIALGAVLVAALACAEEPVRDIDPGRLANLADAQKYVRRAYDKLSDAQFANRDELGGHASRAKELLRQAGEEIKMAALAANGG
jgi:hypothetical protein